MTKSVVMLQAVGYCIMTVGAGVVLNTERRYGLRADTNRLLGVRAIEQVMGGRACRLQC